MTKSSKHRIMASILGALTISAVFAEAPNGWVDKHFGEYDYYDSYVTDATRGGSTYTISGGQTNITIEAGGSDIYSTYDYGRYVFTPMAGDCEIVATVPFIATNTTDYGEWLRAGVMMRGSTMHGAQHICALKVKGSESSGNRLELAQRRSIRGSVSKWSGGGDIEGYAADSDVRIRLRRQGDTFTTWISTNAPTYNLWTLVGTETAAFPRAMNLGAVVSRWWQQTDGPPTYTHPFGNVIARQLVTARASTGGIAIDWIDDTPVAGGSIVGYSVNRAPAYSDTFTNLTALGSATFSYSDTTAGSGTSYVYRVNALVEESGAITNEVLVGESLQLRGSDQANPSPAPIKGIAAEYYDNTSGYDAVGARVDPYIDNSWNIDVNSTPDAVYPAGTHDGLTSLDHFRAAWNGSVVVEESGCYEIYVLTDDISNIYIDEERLIYNNEYQSGEWMHTTPFYLEAGRVYPFKADMQENSGEEALSIHWFKADGSSVSPIRMENVFEPFPQPWQHKDLGQSPLFGNAHFNDNDLSFNIAAGIGDIDNQHLIWTKSSVDFDMLASVELTNPGDAGVNAGVTARSSSEMGARVISIALVSDGMNGAERKIAVTIRETENGSINESDVAIQEAVADLRLSRRGDSLLACYRTASSGGWVVATNLVADLPSELRLGMRSYTATADMYATNTFSAVTLVEDLNADLSASANNLRAAISTKGNYILQEQQRAALPNVAWYWRSHVSDVVDGAYNVSKSDHWENNYAALTTLNAGNNYAYSDPLSASNTVYFYKMNFMYALGAFADGRTNNILLSSAPSGVSDGSIVSNGSGLYNAYYRGVSTYFPTNTPAHIQVGALKNYEKLTSTPIITAAESDDGQQVGPDYFSSSWAGYITPPYSGYYSFRTDTDDAIVFSLNGKVLYEHYGYAKVKTAPDVYLEAGVSVPIYYYYQQGGGGAYFRAYWKHGVGPGAGYVNIPTSVLSPLAPEDTPLFVDATGADKFGNWKNIDVGAPLYPGHAVMSGTPEDFNCKVVGGGKDIWGTEDQFHYLFQETADNFEIECTLSARLDTDDWSKSGLMVRESTATGSRHINIIQPATPSNGRRVQYRRDTDGQSGEYSTFQPVGSPPTKFKIVRKGRKIAFFLDDQPFPLADSGTFEHDISSWNSDTVMVGFFVTSHVESCLSESIFNDVKFTILHDPGAVLILK